MRDLKPYAVFAEVVGAGSMSAAARRLGMTPSAVSQTISALERLSGVRLLHRSTRRLVLTEAGERCYPHCLRLLEAARAASTSLERARNAPVGELRIAAPLGFGAHLAPALAPVLAEWPQLRLSVIVDDALINLAESRIDIALRVGELPDSSWVGRRLCKLETVLCASPAYLERHSLPDTPADLPRHHWLALMDKVHESEAEPLPTFPLELLGQDDTCERTTLHVRTTTTHQIALRQMCEQGMGIAHLFHIDVRHPLEQGLLVRLLPKYRLPSHPLTMLTPDPGAGPAKVDVAIAALQRYFSTLPPASRGEAGQAPFQPTADLITR